MVMRRFFARVFGFQAAPVRPVRRPPADPLAQAYEDALLILDCIYAGEPWSRRALADRMSQPRWTTATAVLKAAGILDSKGRRASLDYDPQTAEALVREAVRAERVKRRNPRYVSPWS